MGALADHRAIALTRHAGRPELLIDQ